MKKFLIFSLSLFALSLLAFGVFLFIIFQPVATPGPKAYYRVSEGQIEVFGLKDGHVRSFLGFVGPKEMLRAPSIPSASLQVPFWLAWLEPILIEGLGRARYLIHELGEQTTSLQFTKTYTYESIRKGVIREVERNPLVRNVLIDFTDKGFSAYASIAGISLSARGSAGVVPGGEDQLFLRLTWVKLGPLALPPHILRLIEALFARAYAQTGKFSLRLTKVNFYARTMALTFQKI